MNGLLVVAHPDDETLFFGGMLLRNKKVHWTVVCVTDGNYQGRGTERRLELKRACQKLKVKTSLCLDFADHPKKRLPVDRLKAELRKFTGFDLIYTHNPFGEYGHVNHQDVSFAVHTTLGKNKKIWSPAWNLFPENRVLLTKSEYNLKCTILNTIYLEEAKRWNINQWNFATEGFVSYKNTEAAKIYSYLRSGGDRQGLPRNLKKWQLGFSFNT